MGIKMWLSPFIQVIEAALAMVVGALAIDRTYAGANAVFNLCLIEGSNPSSKSGKIKKVRFYLKGTITRSPIKIGTFYKTNGNTFSSRDYMSESLDIQLGLNEWDVDLDVEIGDYIGIRLPAIPSGNGIALDYDAGWTNDFWRTLAKSDFPYTNYVFNNLGKRIISLSGWG